MKNEKKICVIGNSHLGALKEGLDRFELSSLTYWGVAGKNFPQIKYNNGVLLTSNSKYSLLLSDGKYDDLVLEDFDILYFYGCHVEISPVIKRLADKITRNGFFSEDFLIEYLGFEFKKWWGGLTFSEIIKPIVEDFPDVKIYFTPHPLWSSDIKSDFDEISEIEFDRCLRFIYNFIFSRCEELGLKLIKQPDKTIEKSFTKSIYSRDSVKLATNSIKHEESDYVHMNSIYGEEISNLFIRELSF